eukprot:m.37771 g.37771  ORF g.37771 m.37771 type:complete len:51 (-) comp11425_c0_seq2:496-648(-)
MYFFFSFFIFFSLVYFGCGLSVVYLVLPDGFLKQIQYSNMEKWLGVKHIC